MTTQPAPVLECRRLVAGYGKSTVLNGIDFEVGDECVALVGPNGAGKTTLVSCLSGVKSIRQGRVLVQGEDLTGSSTRDFVRRGVVLCPEGRHLFPRMTVHENLGMGFPSWNRPRDEYSTRLERVYALFPELGRLRPRHAGSLSGGEQQMVALGRSLMASPRLLVLDEPSLGLAPLLVERLFAIVAEIRSTGCAILISEQNVLASLDIADRAYVLEAGEIRASGDAATLLADEDLIGAFVGRTSADPRREGE